MRTVPLRLSCLMGLAVAAGGALGVGAAASGCGTVDPGDYTGPPKACNAPTGFFVTDVWPGYFAAYGCGMSDCHDSRAGHGYFRLQDVSGVAAPAEATPLAAWPDAWKANYRAVTQNLSCAEPTASIVLAVPSGRGQPHPPGVVVTDLDAATALFTRWLE